MASTTFVNYQTVIDAGWLNDVNSAVYSGTFQASTITPTNVTSSGAISGATVAGTTSVTTPIVKSGTSLSLQTNGSTTAVTIDTAQNVGIGITPVYKLDVVGLASQGYFRFKGGSTGAGYGAFLNAAGTTIGYLGNGVSGASNAGAATDFAIRYESNLLFAYGGSSSAAMTLDNSGQLLVNQTSSSLGATTYIQSSANLASQVCAAFKDTGTTYGSSSNYIYFLNSSGSVAGGIQHTASTVVVYNATSDERLKENIVDAPNALDKVLNIPVRSYDWKEDKQHVDYGFIAQELGKIYIEPVSVGGDNEKQNPWGVDYGRLTPLLVKAIQEQQAIIESLTQRILTLENK